MLLQNDYIHFEPKDVPSLIGFIVFMIHKKNWENYLKSARLAMPFDKFLQQMTHSLNAIKSGNGTINNSKFKIKVRTVSEQLNGHDDIDNYASQYMAKTGFNEAEMRLASYVLVSSSFFEEERVWELYTECYTLHWTVSVLSQSPCGIA